MDKKTTIYQARKNDILQVLQSSNSAEQLENNLLKSADHDENNHRDFLTRYLLSIPTGIPDEIFDLIGGNKEDYRNQAAYTALYYAVNEKSYNKRFANRTPEEQLGFCVKVYKCRLKDIKKSAIARMKRSTNNSDNSATCDDGLFLPVSLEQLVEDHGDAAFSKVLDSHDTDIEKTIERQYLHEIIPKVIEEIDGILSMRELLCFILSKYFGISSAESEKYLHKRTYGEVFKMIYNYNPVLFASLKKYTRIDKSFYSEDITHAYANAASSASKKIRNADFSFEKTLSNNQSYTR